MEFDPNQLEAPPSFVELYVEPGQQRPSASREAIFERYEFCHELAVMLTEQADAMRDSAGLSTIQVLRTCHAGLLADDSLISAKEAGWTVGHLAELLEWRFAPGDLDG